MNNVSYFPSVRLAFKDVTRSIDNLMNEASKHNQHDVAEAYRQAFTLIRQGIERIEKQGESSLHKHLANDINDLNVLTKEACNKIKEFIEQEAISAYEGTKLGMIAILQRKGFNDSNIEEHMSEIEEIAQDEVNNVFSEEGIGFSGD